MLVLRRGEAVDDQGGHRFGGGVDQDRDFGFLTFRERLQHVVRGIDVLVIGGGITGTGIALDAASRGLRVALVERHDLAHGTSRWSSKLIHGGLRYLAKGDVGIAWESAVERAAIGGWIAPHLVRPLTQVLPLRPGEDLQRVGARVGLFAADALRVAARTDRKLLGRSYPLDLAEIAAIAPALDTGQLERGLAVEDLQLEDDARFVIAVARTAAAYGASILTRVSAEEVIGDRVRLRDQIGGGEFTVRARCIVNATGVWADQLDPSIRLAPSLGAHLVVRSASLDDSTASMAVPVPGHWGRYVFTLPQPDGLTYIALTDEPFDGPIPDEPQAPDDHVEWMLGVLNPMLRRELTMADVVGRFAGLRPLLAGQDEAESADISRKHAIVRHDNLITVTGGKFTAYRRMAQDVVDLVSMRPGRTRRLALVGAPGAPAGALPRLARRYGAEATAVAAAGSVEPIAPGVPVCEAELRWAVEHELALTPEDLADRRTRAGLVPEWREVVLAAARATIPGCSSAPSPPPTSTTSPS